MKNVIKFLSIFFLLLSFSKASSAYSYTRIECVDRYDIEGIYIGQRCKYYYYYVEPRPPNLSILRPPSNQPIPPQVKPSLPPSQENNIEGPRNEGRYSSGHNREGPSAPRRNNYSLPEPDDNYYNGPSSREIAEQNIQKYNENVGRNLRESIEQGTRILKKEYRMKHIKEDALIFKNGGLDFSLKEVIEKSEKSLRLGERAISNQRKDSKKDEIKENTFKSLVHILINGAGLAGSSGVLLVKRALDATNSSSQIKFDKQIAKELSKNELTKEELAPFLKMLITENPSQLNTPHFFSAALGKDIRFNLKIPLERSLFNSYVYSHKKMTETSMAEKRYGEYKSAAALAEAGQLLRSKDGAKISSFFYDLAKSINFNRTTEFVSLINEIVESSTLFQKGLGVSLANNMNPLSLLYQLDPECDGDSWCLAGSYMGDALSFGISLVTIAGGLSISGAGAAGAITSAFAIPATGGASALAVPGSISAAMTGMGLTLYGVKSGFSSLKNMGNKILTKNNSLKIKKSKKVIDSARKLGLKAKDEIADFTKFSSKILDNTGSVGNLSKSKVWTKGPKFNGVENAFSHWKKHGKTFPELNNAKEYVDKAKSFFSSPPSGTISKTRPNGDQLLYNPKTNIFGVKTKNGLPKTMFKPKAGQGYWDRLIKKEGL